MTRGTTQPGGGIDVRVSLLENHSAACALEERAATLLQQARALRRQLSRTISSRTGATRKNSGTARSKVSATTATSASNKRKKTRANKSALTAGRCDICGEPAVRGIIWHDPLKRCSSYPGRR